MIGIASLLAGYAYSAGRRPLSHGPFGEVYVIVFFGLVAVAGSYYLQSGQLPGSGILLTGIAVGCYAAAVLLVNNLRDTEADLRAGRKTLAARLGLHGSRFLYGLLVLVPFPMLAAALGVVFIVGRVLYLRAYLVDPARRGPRWAYRRSD